MLLRNDSCRGEAAAPAATNRIPQATRMPLQDFARDTHATTVPEMEHAIDSLIRFLAFFFQAEDGIRDGRVTGVQTCALPIYCNQHVCTSIIPGCWHRQTC